MAAGDIYELDVHQDIKGDKLVNRFFYSEDSSVSNPEDALEAQWVAGVRGFWVAAVCPDLLIVSLSIRRVFPTEGGSWLYNEGQLGTDPGETTPPNSVALIQLYTATINKTGRGRTHISGISQDGIADGLLQVAQHGNLQTLANGITAPLTNFQAGIFSGSPPSFKPFDFSRVKTHMYTLRSRKMARP